MANDDANLQLQRDLTAALEQQRKQEVDREQREREERARRMREALLQEQEASRQSKLNINFFTR